MASFYLESSALVKRYVAEIGTTWVRGLSTPTAANTLFIAQIAGVEVVAAIALRARRGATSPADAVTAAANFRRDFALGYYSVPVTLGVIGHAMNLAERHGLRGYDAVQLASALEVQAKCLALSIPQLSSSAPTQISTPPRPLKGWRWMTRMLIPSEDLTQKGSVMPAWLRVICLCLCVSAAAGLASSAAWAGGTKHTEIVQTFEPARNNGTPLVQVRFSNTVIGTFIIDTGEYESVITEDFAKRAGLKLTAQSVPLIFGILRLPGSLQFHTAQPAEIHLENLIITDPVFSVAPPDFIPPFDGRQIDGILGSDLLSQFALRIDYPAHEITWITPGNLNASDAAALGFGPQNFIELGQERAFLDNAKVNHYSLRGDFQNGANTASEDLLIDTGMPVTLVSKTLADELHLHSTGDESVKILDRDAAPYENSAIEKIQIGQSALTDVAVLASQSKDTDIPPILGESVLSDCVVLFDFGPHRFYLKPVLPPALPVSAAPLDKTQIVWDRLRAAPDLPTVEESLSEGLAPDAQDSLDEKAARLKVPDADSAKDVERLEKLGALLREGQDEAGAKAAFAQAVTLASAAAQANPSDGGLARGWVHALSAAGRDDEAVAAATQGTARLPADELAWRLLGSTALFRAINLLSGERLTLTNAEALRLRQGVPDSRATPAQAALVQPLLAQARAAFDKSIYLAPADAEGYQERGLFRLFDRVALTALQRAGVKVTLPAADVPSEEAALAQAVADWQQWAVLSPDSAECLADIAYLDQKLPVFHDRAWLTQHLKGSQTALPATLMTADMAQADLTRLTQSADKTQAAAAWIALGRVQAEKGDASDTDSEKSWRQALALIPAQPDALTALASHLQQAGRWTELRDLLTHQAAACDSVPTRLALASVLTGEGQLAGAEAQVRAAKALNPNNAAVNLTLAEMLLARSSGDPAALAEASTCLGAARAGYAALATPEQKATLTTAQAVWLALDHDPDTAEKQLVSLAREQPTCTQAREALAALVPYQ